MTVVLDTVLVFVLVLVVFTVLVVVVFLDDVVVVFFDDVVVDLCEVVVVVGDGRHWLYQSTYTPGKVSTRLISGIKL